MVEPRYPKRAAIPSVLDPYKEQLAAWLKTDSHRKQARASWHQGHVPGIASRATQAAEARSTSSPSAGSGAVRSHAHGVCAHEFEMGGGLPV